MFRCVVVYALLACCAGAGAGAGGAQGSGEGVSICHNFTYNRRQHSICYSDQDVAATPSWEPEAAEPPLSRAEVLKASRASLAKYVKTPGHWQIGSLQLNRVGGAGKWVYVVGFDCPAKECGDDYRERFTLVVNMAGAVIEPKSPPQ